MLVVLVTNKEFGGTVPYGPYRSMERAQQIVELLNDPSSTVYRGDEEYDIRVAKLEKYED